MLSANCATDCSWQDVHCAGGSFAGCCASLIVLWQSTQLVFAWTDFAKSSGRTPIHSGGSPFFLGLNSASWQSMHSEFGTAGGIVEVAARPFAMANASTAIRRLAAGTS